MKQLLHFIGVGGGAALTHYVCAIAFVFFGITPLLANLLAFLMAFWVSYFGHKQFTFASSNSQHQQALPRFALVAILGFFINEGLLALGLHYLLLPFWLILIGVMIITAVCTFILSRYFAFKTVDNAL